MYNTNIYNQFNGDLRQDSLCFISKSLHRFPVAFQPTATYVWFYTYPLTQLSFVASLTLARLLSLLPSTPRYSGLAHRRVPCSILYLDPSQIVPPACQLHLVYLGYIYLSFFSRLSCITSSSLLPLLSIPIFSLCVLSRELNSHSWPILWYFAVSLSDLILPHWIFLSPSVPSFVISLMQYF